MLRAREVQETDFSEDAALPFVQGLGVHVQPEALVRAADVDASRGTAEVAFHQVQAGAAHVGVVHIDDVVSDLDGQVAHNAVAPEPRCEPAGEGVDLELVTTFAGHGPLEEADALEVEGAESTVAVGDVRVTPEVTLREAVVVPVIDVATRARRGQVGRACQRKLAEAKKERGSETCHAGNAASREWAPAS